jgi:hypothetical protein
MRRHLLEKRGWSDARFGGGGEYLLCNFAVGVQSLRVAVSPGDARGKRKLVLVNRVRN